MPTCDVMAFIQQGLADANTPPETRVLNAVRDITREAVEAGDSDRLATVNTVAERIGYKNAQAGRYLRELFDAGVLTRFPRGGKHIYVVKE